MNQKTSVIGLGVMGQRMLNNMQRYAGFDVLSAWDPDDEACRRVAENFPGVKIAATAKEAIGHAQTSVVYIACPPNYHEQHALAAFAAGKSVYCEKPLGVDIVQSESLVEQARASGLPNIVNFSLASACATREMERQLAGGVLGAVWGVDIRVHFATWPRDWQMAAADWLSYRDEGGFTREVVSHWIYLTERLLGCVELEDTRVRYPRGNLAETHLQATLNAQGVPVSVAASSGGVGPDLVEYTLWGTTASLRVVDWNELFVSDGGQWRAALPDVNDPREKGYELQLENAAAATAGQPHTMPTFADALSVQTIIEAMLE